MPGLQTQVNATRWLLPALLACASANLLHHIHNAAFLDHYPGMPAWISARMVHAAWLVTTAIAIGGYYALRRGWRVVGLGLLALYGLYGLDSLVHYALAPFAAHNSAMNASIWLEALAAAALLVVILRELGLRPRS